MTSTRKKQTAIEVNFVTHYIITVTFLIFKLPVLLSTLFLGRFIARTHSTAVVRVTCPNHVQVCWPLNSSAVCFSLTPHSSSASLTELSLLSYWDTRALRTAVELSSGIYNATVLLCQPYKLLPTVFVYVRMYERTSIHYEFV